MAEHIWWCPGCERIIELESLKYGELCPLCNIETVQIAPIKELVSALKTACDHMEYEGRCPVPVGCENCYIYKAIGELL